MKISACLKNIPLIGKPLAKLLEKDPVVPVLVLEGVIGQGGGFRKSGLNLKELEETIEEAFSSDDIKAVALVINSPGGSPVQSDLIAQRIRALAVEKGKPVFAFVEDAAASGGYWLACAADEIYARPASIVGSIGVISAGFGFPKLLEKMGVERRVYTAGKSKSQLDPFSPEKQDDVDRIKALQVDIHEQFCAYVKDRRGSKLNGSEDDLFNGAFWTGSKAEQLGLVDGLIDMRSFLRSRYGDKVKTPVMTKKKGWLAKYISAKSSVSDEVVTSALGSLSNSVEERSLWGRLGL